MLDQGNRTFIGSVVFVDIVGYSKKTVSEQIAIKDRFTTLLSDALIDIAPEQRLILDTGDGAALSFLGDPEDALFVSMSMRDLVRRVGDIPTEVPAEPIIDADGIAGTVPLPLRIGINLGPVKLVRDINGYPNIVGDGINVAQRIMSFAQPGQIVVSRSFFDVVSVISDEYAKLFKYEGSRTDKHVREHEIYVVGESDAAFKQVKAGMVDRAASTNPQVRQPGYVGVSTGTYGYRQPTLDDSAPVPFLQDRKKLTIAGGALAALVLILVLALILKKPADKAADPLSGKTETLRVEQPRVDVAAAPQASVPTDTARAAEGNGQAPATSPSLKSDGKADAAKGIDPKADPKADPTKSAIQTGNINFSVLPWGEVFVNGKSIGVSPPMKQTKLPPGKYKIEVKNTSFTPFVANVEVKFKEDVNIKHKFQ